MVPALLRLESSRLDIIRTLKLSPTPLHWSGAGVLLLLHHLLMLVSKLLHFTMLYKTEVSVVYLNWS